MKKLVASLAGIAVALVTALIVATYPSHTSAQEGFGCQTPNIQVSSSLPLPQTDGSTGGVDLACGAQYAWNAFIALNWPAKAGVRDVADTGQNFGGDTTTVWESMRAKDELYPGNASATVAPHGVVLNPTTHLPANAPDYGYSDPVQYVYLPSAVGTTNGQAMPCAGQAPVASPAMIPLDETTEIGNNQTYAGIAPPSDPKGYNTKPQLIRYAVKMSKYVYQQVIGGQLWNGNGTPFATATGNYTAALAKGQSANPASPYVNFAPPIPPQGQAEQTAIEVKSAWRPLSSAEASSGHFFTSTVRYFETNTKGQPCYREAVWGLVGMHLISFTPQAPWVIWSTFEQADNILTAGGQPTEDADGNLKPTTLHVTPTSPVLSSNPNVVAPVVTATGPYCAKPGARLYFHENPTEALPSGGAICVNARWHAIPGGIIATNAAAHTAIKAYLAKIGAKTSPWLYYKLINSQATPVDATQMNNQRFSTTESYYMANSTIETDYSLGEFTGDLVNGAPSNVTAPNVPYYNTQLLPFQTSNLSFLQKPLQMGGCAGCHGFAASIGQSLSFALGNNVTEPESTDAFKKGHLFRDYFPNKKSTGASSKLIKS